MIEDIAKKCLNPFIEKGTSERRRYGRLGEIEGKSELPSSDSKVLSSHEQNLLDSAVEKWKEFKDNLIIERQKLERELSNLASKISHNIEPSELITASEQSKSLELLQSEMGESSSTYIELKEEFDETQSTLNSIKSELGRPLSINFVYTYLPLMFGLSIAELYVNRLSFELVFESMPIVSILLASAVGILLMFFAHIIGTQVKRSMCPISANNNTRTYGAVVFIALISLILILSLAIMRQQLLDLNAVNVDLDELIKDGTTSQSNFSNILPSAKSIPFLVINFAIFISGIILAFLRHDSNPYYEKYTRDFTKAKINLQNHTKKYEAKQIELMREYNLKMNANNKSKISFENNIKELELQLQFIANADKEYLDIFVNEVLNCLKEFRQKNIAARKTSAPDYFRNSIEQKFRSELLS